MFRTIALFGRRGQGIARNPRHFERGALILATTSAGSYALGVLRDRVLAGTFGATDPLDVYQASFIVPDFLFNLLVAGALSSAFIPVFTDLRTKSRNEDAARLAGTLLTIGLAVLLVVGALAFLFAEPLTFAVAPGFPQEKRALLVHLTRVMLLSPLLFLASNLFGSMLVSTKRFFFYGLSPVLYNLGIILGALVLAPALGVFGVAVGTILGAALHLLARAIDVRRAGLRLILVPAFSADVRKVLVLMIPRMAGLTAVQVQLSAFNAIASTLGEGTVTVMNLARNFQSFPVSLIGIAFATSLFPLLAESASRHSQASYTRRLLRGAWMTLAVAVPAAAIMYVLRTALVSLFVGTGAFNPAAVQATAMILGIFTFSIPVESLAHVLSRGFYALQNTLIPTSISIAAILASIASSVLLTGSLGVLGIPAGFAVGASLHALLLIALLPLWARRAFRQPLATSEAKAEA